MLDLDTAENNLHLNVCCWLRLLASWRTRRRSSIRCRTSVSHLVSASSWRISGQFPGTAAVPGAGVHDDRNDDRDDEDDDLDDGDVDVSGTSHGGAAW